MDRSLDVVWTFMVDYPKGWGVRRHSHDYFQMYYCTAGQGTMFLDGNNIVLKQNDTLIIRPNQMHELYPIKTGQLRVIDTKFYIRDRELRDALLRAPQRIVVTDPRFRDLQQSMRNEWVSGELYSREMAALLFEQIVLFCLRDNTLPPVKPPFYQTLREQTEKLTGLPRTLADYLTTHFLDELTLDRIAADLRYSKNYLCKIFKNSSGFTITEYVNHLRISKAYDLVCSTSYPFSEISAQCGFSSIHYFSRVFRNVVGMSPSQARDQEQNSLYTDIRLHGTFRYRYFSPSGADGERSASSPGQEEPVHRANNA